MQIKFADKCMDVFQGGRVVGIWNCNGGLNQQFSFTAFQDGYRIQSRTALMCLEIANGGLQEAACTDAAGTKFKPQAGEKHCPGNSTHA